MHENDVPVFVGQLPPKPGNELTDLAIDPRDAIFDSETITGLIHNTGNRAVGTFEVGFSRKRTANIFKRIRYSADLRIQVGPNDEWTKILEKTIGVCAKVGRDSNRYCTASIIDISRYEK